MSTLLILIMLLPVPVIFLDTVVIVEVVGAELIGAGEDLNAGVETGAEVDAGANATVTGETVGANAWGKIGAYVVEGAGA